MNILLMKNRLGTNINMFHFVVVDTIYNIFNIHLTPQSLKNFLICLRF